MDKPSWRDDLLAKIARGEVCSFCYRPGHRYEDHPIAPVELVNGLADKIDAALRPRQIVRRPD